MVKWFGLGQATITIGLQSWLLAMVGAMPVLGEGGCALSFSQMKQQGILACELINSYLGRKAFGGNWNSGQRNPS